MGARPLLSLAEVGADLGNRGYRDERSRANAIETLASLPQRRFVIPILPLIESRETAEAGPGLGQPDPASIEEALSSPDPAGQGPWTRSCFISRTARFWRGASPSDPRPSRAKESGSHWTHRWRKADS